MLSYFESGVDSHVDKILATAKARHKPEMPEIASFALKGSLESTTVKLEGGKSRISSETEESLGHSDERKKSVAALCKQLSHLK